MAILFSGIFYFLFFSGPTIEDLSEGTLPLTFKTKNPDLQKLLLKIAKEKGLPNQIIKDPGIPDEENFAAAFLKFYESPQFQELLKEYNIWQKEWDEAYARVDYSPALGLRVPRANKINFLENSKRFNEAFEKNKSFATKLNKILQMPKCFFQMKILKAGQAGVDLNIVSADISMKKKIWMVSYINYLYFLSCAAKNKNKEAILALDNIYAMVYRIMNSNVINETLLSNDIARRPFKEFLMNRKFNKSQKKDFFKVLKKWKEKTYPQKKFFTIFRANIMLIFELFHKKRPEFLCDRTPFLKQINPFENSFEDIKLVILRKWQLFNYDIEKDEIEFLSFLEKFISDPSLTKYKSSSSYSEYAGVFYERIIFKSYEFSLFRARLDAFYILFSEDLGINIDEERKSMINPLDGKPYSKDHKELKKLLEYPD